MHKQKNYIQTVNKETENLQPGVIVIKGKSELSPELTAHYPVGSSPAWLEPPAWLEDKNRASDQAGTVWYQSSQVTG